MTPDYCRSLSLAVVTITAVLFPRVAPLSFLSFIFLGPFVTVPHSVLQL